MLCFVPLADRTAPDELVDPVKGLRVIEGGALVVDHLLNTFVASMSMG
jgi:hypothetical protein